MKTCLVTTTHLVPEERFNKTVKFVEYYKKNIPEWNIIILDNGSPQAELETFCDIIDVPFSNTLIHFSQYYGRPSHLDYKYLWRAVYKLDEFFDRGYEKVVYMDNDFFILKQEMVDYVNNLNAGWTTFFCKKYDFPETGCHIIVKDNPEYSNFIACPEDEFFKRYNGKEMEHVLPVTHVEKKFHGDRYGELYPNSIQYPCMHYWAQAHPNDQLIFEMKDGK